MNKEILSIRDCTDARFTVETRPNQFDETIINYRLVIARPGKGEGYFYANREQYQAFIRSEYQRLFGGHALDPCAVAGFHVCGPKDTELRKTVEDYIAAPAAEC